LLRYEVTNALHRLHAVSAISEEIAEGALRSALDLPVVLADDPALHVEALAVAARFQLPAAYDAHYLALSEREGADFWTTDRRLANAVGTALPWVHLVGS
jgi:predicted nucleic acid-binding protein